MYLADELLHFCCGEAIQHSTHSNADEERQLIIPSSSQQQQQQTQQQHHHHHSHSHHSTNYGSIDKDLKSNFKEQTCEEHQHEHDVEDERINERLCHTSHLEPCRETLAGIIGMLTALSIHSLIEGLAIGIQDTTARVMILFAAVISHKFVVGFCLGVELSVSPGATFKHHFVAILVFSAGSVLGIAIGMGLVDLNSVVDSKFLPIMQGIAGGTLLYVTVCEVLPRERARWHQNQVNRGAGLFQLLAFTMGFAVMTLLNMYISDDE